LNFFDIKHVVPFYLIAEKRSLHPSTSHIVDPLDPGVMTSSKAMLFDANHAMPITKDWAWLPKAPSLKPGILMHELCEFC